MSWNCFRICHGQSSVQHTSESPERYTLTETPISTSSFNFLENQTSRMNDFSTYLTHQGLPLSTLISKQPKTPTPSRITSPKRVIIVNPDNTRCLGQQEQTRRTYTTTPFTQSQWRQLLQSLRQGIQ
ncbi:AC4 protein [Jacquemontia mosaic Yucatan virus]|uniref:AC4 protein n=1 Tax=Jacquemontia mosaic Yucatan virus TaxID=1198450 RepID=I6R6Z1_9GEMI|nr:AC4 protein [Jacquemontia mosaic Yucatan virus]AFM38722.1 AC4 protein [Jacquemontia mosaic Yucatan virus]